MIISRNTYKFILIRRLVGNGLKVFSSSHSMRMRISKLVLSIDIISGFFKIGYL